MKIEPTNVGLDNESIRITDSTGSQVHLSKAEGWDLLEWLYQRRSELWASQQASYRHPLKRMIDHIVTGDTTIYRGGRDEQL